MQYAYAQLNEVGICIGESMLSAEVDSPLLIPIAEADGSRLGKRWEGGEWEVVTVPLPSLADRQAASWERIKTERDRRKFSGVRVGPNWFHSDADSRTQQIGLVIAGAALPVGLNWKTLTAAGGLSEPVFVTMTPQLAQQIFQATMQSDAAIFAAAEAHRVAMLADVAPESYSIAAGWPAAFGDAA